MYVSSRLIVSLSSPPLSLVAARPFCCRRQLKKRRNAARKLRVQLLLDHNARFIQRLFRMNSKWVRFQPIVEAFRRSILEQKYDLKYISSSLLIILFNVMILPFLPSFLPHHHFVSSAKKIQKLIRCFLATCRVYHCIVARAEKNRLEAEKQRNKAAANVVGRFVRRRREMFTLNQLFILRRKVNSQTVTTIPPTALGDSFDPSSLPLFSLSPPSGSITPFSLSSSYLSPFFSLLLCEIDSR
jgi:hypothetical protein